MGGQTSKNEFRVHIRRKILEVLTNCPFISPTPVCFTFQISRENRAFFGENEISSLILKELQDIIKSEDIPLRHISERRSSAATKELVITEIYGYVVNNSLLQIWDNKKGTSAGKMKPGLAKIEIPHQDFKILL